jgi:hypothetical protein
MKCKLRYILSALVWALMLTTYNFTAQAQSTTAAHPQPVAQKQSGGNNQSALSTNTTGSGTTGHLSRWLGPNGSGLLGDSSIFEDKFNKVGIGTETPTSKLTVQGMIETTLGGYKFPDGTVQTTALSAGQVVSSLNGLKGDVTLAAGKNISITATSGNTLTIAAPNVLTFVRRDSTLTGDGASTALGIAAPLFLSGREGNEALGVLNVENIEPGETNAIFAHGAAASGTFFPGTGLFALGGDPSATLAGGAGLVSAGGSGDNGGSGGVGAILIGGRASGAGHKAGTAFIASAGDPSNGATKGLAGDFRGDVSVFGNLAVSGNLIKGGGSFKIDHPLDPENKYLSHSFVESPDMMNIYNGTVTTDGNGDATVTLPDWFEALNQDFRYQLTVIGTFAQAIVAQKVKGNRFTVKTNAPNVEVSWQVTGIRHDAYANKHRIPVEEQKLEDERGLYLHPDAFNQPEDKGIQFVRNAPQIERLNAAHERVRSQSQQ